MRLVSAVLLAALTGLVACGGGSPDDHAGEPRERMQAEEGRKREPRELTEEEKGMLEARPGDRVVSYTFDLERKAEIERKMRRLADVTNTRVVDVERQYLGVIENIVGMDLERLQVGVWHVLQDGGMPEEVAKAHSILDCLIILTSEEVRNAGDGEGLIPITYEQMVELLDSQIERFAGLGGAESATGGESPDQPPPGGERPAGSP
jgi:hypothetical protein